VPNFSARPKLTLGDQRAKILSIGAIVHAQGKKSPSKGLSDYQLEFCIQRSDQLVLSGSVGSGRLKFQILIYATVEKIEAAIAQLKMFRKRASHWGRCLQ